MLDPMLPELKPPPEPLLTPPPRARRWSVERLPSSGGTIHDLVSSGLTASPKQLSSMLLYDARGSRLFDQICTLPEYYPPRIERALIEAHLPAIAEDLE